MLLHVVHTPTTCCVLYCIPILTPSMCCRGYLTTYCCIPYSVDVYVTLCMHGHTVVHVQRLGPLHLSTYIMGTYCLVDVLDTVVLYGTLCSIHIDTWRLTDTIAIYSFVVPRASYLLRVPASCSSSDYHR